MTKLQKILLILTTLSKDSSRTTSTQDLMDATGLNERQIRLYAAEMRQAGINIIGYRGHEGGYRLESCPVCIHSEKGN